MPIQYDGPSTSASPRKTAGQENLGWSAGGTIAFEMAQQLSQCGEQVDVVALFDSYSPHTGADYDEMTMLMWQVWRFKLDVTIEQLEAFPTFEERLDFIVRQGLATKKIQPQISFEQARRLLLIEVRNLQGTLNYRPEIYDGQLQMFRCEVATDFGEFNRFFPAINTLDHVQAWDQLSTQPIQVFNIPGDHAALMDEPNVEVLAQNLKDCITKAEQQRMRAVDENGETEPTPRGEPWRAHSTAS